LAKDCDFKAVTAEEYRDNSIRDTFISGIASSTIHQRLLEKKELDLQTAYESARSLEMAEKQNQSFRPMYSAATNASELDQSVQSISLEESNITASTSSRPQTQNACFFCGFPRHPRSSCPAKDSTCRKCNKKGHFQKVCMSRKAQTGSSAAMLNSNPQIAVLASVTPSLAKTTINVKVNKINTKALIDTGSTESFISESVVKSRNLNVIPSSSRISMATSDLVKKKLLAMFMST